MNDQIDVICDAFETAWMQGRSPSIEAELKKLPQELSRKGLFELLRVEICLRTSAHETISKGEYLERFPKFADLVDAAFQNSRNRKFVLQETDERIEALTGTQLSLFLYDCCRLLSGGVAQSVIWLSCVFIGIRFGVVPVAGFLVQLIASIVKSRWWPGLPRASRIHPTRLGWAMTLGACALSVASIVVNQIPFEFHYAIYENSYEGEASYEMAMNAAIARQEGEQEFDIWEIPSHETLENGAFEKPLRDSWGIRSWCRNAFSNHLVANACERGIVLTRNKIDRPCRRCSLHADCFSEA